MTASRPSGPTPPVARAPAAGVGAPPLTLIFAVTVTGIMANTLINPAIPDILEHFDRPTRDVGFLVTSGAVPGIIMAPVMGILADRFGRRRVLFPCLISFGVFGLLAGLSPTFETLLLLRLAQGIGSAGLINLAVVVIGDHWDGVARTRIIGQNAAVLTTCLAVLPALGGLLTEVGGWRLAFAPYPIGLLTALAVWRFLPDVDFEPADSLRGQLSQAGVVLRRPVVVSSMVTGFVVFVLIFGLFLAALPIHLDAEFGLGPGLRGLVLAAPAATSTLAALYLGRMRSRFGAARLLAGAWAVFAVAFTTIGLAPGLPLLLVAAMAYGLGEGTAIPTLQDLVASAGPAESRGAVMAVFVGAIRAGQACGPLLVGVALGSVATGTVFVAGGLVAGLVLVVLIALGPRTGTSTE